MSILRLSFEKIKSQDPHALAKALIEARIIGIRESLTEEGKRRRFSQINDDFTELQVSFARAGFFTVSDLAILAAVIRKVAEKGREVTIWWPRPSRGEPSALQHFLERIEFADLFKRQNNSEGWRRYVSIKGRKELKKYRPEPHETTHYIPMRWFNIKDFVLSGEDNIWKERPSVAPALERAFRLVLLGQGFADIDKINILNSVIFLELAWNTVLHSAQIPGTGDGVFCAQIRHEEGQPSSLTFCIVDAGLGIPRTLLSHLDAAVEQGTYYSDKSRTDHSNVVRFAFENNASSRPEFPSQIDKESFRGLALVADSLHEAEELVISSDGGTVRTKCITAGTAQHSLSDENAKSPICGTQISGTLRTSIPAQRRPSSGTGIFDTITLGVVPCCSPSGECSVLMSAESALAFVKSINLKEDVIVLDLGFSSGGVRQLEYLCYAALHQFSSKLLIFWNFSSEWDQCEALSNGVSQNLQANQPTPLFVRGMADARVFCSTAIGQSFRPSWGLGKFLWYASFLQRQSMPSEIHEPFRGSPVDLKLDDYLFITSQVNTAYLSRGFREHAIESGFFSGKINSLSTKVLRRYFAVSSNIASRVDENLKRWVFGGVAAITKLLDMSLLKSKVPVILAFAGSMREVVAHIPQRLLTPTRAYSLLTYDVPTKEQVGSYISREDDVILFTDVVSSGSLLTAVANLVEENGARLLGVVSLVDYRQEAGSDPQAITLGRTQIPFLSASEFPDAPNDGQYAFGDDEYWVDPVTLIPRTSQPLGWNRTLDPRSEQTVRLLIDSEAVRCGHVIDGTRHTSVYVNVEQLLAADTGEILRQVREKCEERLLRRNWDSFSPTRILFPAGIAQIESVERLGRNAADRNGHKLTAYATGARLFANTLRTIWGKSQLVLGEVSRAFDPGGGARCSDQIRYLEEVPDDNKWDDVIIADDGMWRGTTLSSLVRLAVGKGAKRVLAVPLLVRMISRDIEFWESMQAVEGMGGGHGYSSVFCISFSVASSFLCIS